MAFYPDWPGGVGFIPQIALLFMVLSLLLEKWVIWPGLCNFIGPHSEVKFGLNGRSVMGFNFRWGLRHSCNHVHQKHQQSQKRPHRFLCGPAHSLFARIPVYAALIGFIVPAQYYFGCGEFAGTCFMGYFTGISMALITAFVILKFAGHEERVFWRRSPYQWPQLSTG
ncbi:MAG: hypothetical protein IPN15_20095 [Saprospiraceae bacterium]|nr:hypothetical protein [Candidatus Vicinibacter affinis]